MSGAKQLLIEGLSDALGFVGGALAGYWIGVALGMNLFSEGYNASNLLAIALVGIGGGLGLHGARRWRTLQAQRNHKD